MGLFSFLCMLLIWYAIEDVFYPVKGVYSINIYCIFISRARHVLLFRVKVVFWVSCAIWCSWCREVLRRLTKGFVMSGFLAFAVRPGTMWWNFCEVGSVDR